ncbi:MAG: Asp-tRNA(Asn)/Glu-tRNA(Gln) amidotransferase subunit GatC [Candidatus Omnitrophica bacterium]|nr:Asp-tRNA(Asn)/Glu-tRNA(Gln) amidotransferase subunit GatC [Candidatus Omnitrophota bacterium]MBU4479610.1 Asp-tRNA(Asn)/Glu-tRNA(Gln) amidotransferase subunit GatC [Candidatus Omnitrophota bacterium]MCG2703405.1 Asp-tRNA(Asn)/Glu-tRNA(Gln) amidotransferase subunit GatC [Candidatus Omnitrophota bacterium]
MSINKEKVTYVAKLARIELEETSLEDFTLQLDKILKYMEKLNQLDTGNTPATSHVLELKNVFREDIHCPSLPNEEVLANAPEKENGHFRVPKVI